MYWIILFLLSVQFTVPIQITMQLSQTTYLHLEFEDEEKTKNIDDKTDLEKECEKFKHQHTHAHKNFMDQNSVCIKHYPKIFFEDNHIQIHLPPPEHLS